ncbi:MAG TPA: hypothetical protein VEL47_05450 [Myxococcota bacterium]|nr:hypothetical protein [Myxococcota bacterium]
MITKPGFVALISILATVAQAYPFEPVLPGFYLCTATDDANEEILSGTLYSIAGHGKLKFLGHQEVEAYWHHPIQCNHNSSGEEVCVILANKIKISFNSNGKSYSADLRRSEDSLYGYLKDLDEENPSPRSISCAWRG